jgi:hypothetical protein
MMSFGVPLGAKSPVHAESETLGNPSSAKVGISSAAVSGSVLPLPPYALHKFVSYLGKPQPRSCCFGSLCLDP